MTRDIEEIARVAHEVNRAYCASLGDRSQPPWDEAPAWQKQSAMVGVAMHITRDVTPGESHAWWLAEKERDGWVYGQEKNPESKTHPCMVPFDQLPVDQQAKDYIFGAVVKGVLGYREWCIGQESERASKRS